MIYLTKAQRKALKKNVYDRMVADTPPSKKPPTYRQVRRTVQPTFFCDNCIMVRYAGMWLGIERDGYTHS